MEYLVELCGGGFGSVSMPYQVIHSSLDCLDVANTVSHFRGGGITYLVIDNRKILFIKCCAYEATFICKVSVIIHYIQHMGVIINIEHITAGKLNCTVSRFVASICIKEPRAEGFNKQLPCYFINCLAYWGVCLWLPYLHIVVPGIYGHSHKHVLSEAYCVRLVAVYKLDKVSHAFSHIKMLGNDFSSHETQLLNPRVPLVWIHLLMGGEEGEHCSPERLMSCKHQHSYPAGVHAGSFSLGQEKLKRHT